MGKTGRWLVGRALAIGHDVVALAASPGQMGLLHEHLHIVIGDPLDPAAVGATLAGADAVISLLQPEPKPAPLAVSRATAHIIESMQAHGVRRLIVVTDRTVRDPEDHPTWNQRLGAWLESLIAADLQADNWAHARPGARQ
jgi:putative NADH-flavin reductase